MIYMLSSLAAAEMDIDYQIYLTRIVFILSFEKLNRIYVISIYWKKVYQLPSSALEKQIIALITANSKSKSQPQMAFFYWVSG